MEAPVPCVLVVGCAAVGKKTLISRITGSRSDQQVLWTIDTKYYTAQAQILSVNIPPNNNHDSSAQDCESLILIFDAQREETFRQAKEWLIQQSVSPEITLLVANKSELLRGPDGAVQRQTWHEEAQDWCCEQLFEYIEVRSGFRKVLVTNQRRIATVLSTRCEHFSFVTLFPELSSCAFAGERG